MAHAGQKDLAFCSWALGEIPAGSSPPVLCAPFFAAAEGYQPVPGASFNALSVENHVSFLSFKKKKNKTQTNIKRSMAQIKSIRDN